MTWRFVVHDIWTMLKQQYDDADITLTHATYWCSVVANRLLSQHIEKRDSGAFLTVYNNLPVLIEQGTNYKYITLPQNIFDFDRDDGVHILSYNASIDCVPPFASVKFTRTTPAGVIRLHWTQEEKPTPDNPYFYRIGNNLYLLGLENIAAPTLEGAFFQTISPYPLDLNENFPFPDELITVLQRYVFDLGRFVIQMPKDNTNDGAGIQGVGQMPKMSPVKSDVQTQEG
jgi:hypothetical protein